MDSHSKSNVDQSFASLLGGIADEGKELLLQEIALAKLEVRHELSKAKARAVKLAFGIGALGIGSLLLALMLVHGLAIWTAIPLWESYGIVGAVSALLGWAFLSSGRAVKSAESPRRTADRRMESTQ
jgi:hypothetical protein